MCQLCDRRFMRSDHLSKHIKTHSKPRKASFPFKSPLNSPSNNASANSTGTNNTLTTSGVVSAPSEMVPKNAGTGGASSPLESTHHPLSPVKGQQRSNVNNNNSPPLCLSSVGDIGGAGTGGNFSLMDTLQCNEASATNRVHSRTIGSDSANNFSLLNNESLIKSQLADLECLINENKQDSSSPFANCTPMQIN